MAKSISISLDMTKVYLVDDAGSLSSFNLSGDGVEIKLVSGALDVSASNGSFNGAFATSLSTSGQQVGLIFYEGSSDNYLSIIGVSDEIDGIQGDTWDLDSEEVQVFSAEGTIKVYKKSV